MPQAPDFWWRASPGVRARAVWPVSLLWGLGATIRMRRAPRLRPPVPVVCVGNFVVGGAGKTPTVLAIVRAAHALGRRPGILSKGYGGAETGPTRVDPDAHTSADVGDEPLLLAAAAPTVVARDRAAGAKRLVSEGADLIIMDDGFQDPTLTRDLSIVVVDAAAGIGNGLMVPAGPLRAPLDLQLARADALLVIGEGEAAASLAAAAGRMPVLHGRLEPHGGNDLQGRRVLAFAGIGRPEKFFSTLRDAGVEVAATRAFPDHHAFRPAEAEALLAEAARDGLALVTTEKDHVRLRGAGQGPLARLRGEARPFPVRLVLEDPQAIPELLHDAFMRQASAG